MLKDGWRLERWPHHFATRQVIHCYTGCSILHAPSVASVVFCGCIAGVPDSQGLRAERSIVSTTLTTNNIEMLCGSILKSHVHPLVSRNKRGGCCPSTQSNSQNNHLSQKQPSGGQSGPHLV